MKLPRNISAQQLISSLEKLGYSITRQKGSHVRLTYSSMEGEHHLTIPNHDPLKVGTLNHIIKDLAYFHKIDKSELILKLFS